MSILVFQHDHRCPPGRLGSVLRDHAFRLDVRNVAKPVSEGGDPFPPDLDGVQAVLSLGGPQSVTRHEDWMSREMEILKEAHDRELPVVGICLGHQLLGSALGTDVRKAERSELGFVPVTLTPPAQTETILAGVPWTTRMYQSHSDEVVGVPPGATLLASSDACKVQAFKAGMRSFGFQFHFEYTRETIARNVREFPEMLEETGLSVEAVEAQGEEHFDRFAITGDRICANLATFCFPFERLLAS